MSKTDSGGKKRILSRIFRKKQSHHEPSSPVSTSTSFSTDTKFSTQRSVNIQPQTSKAGSQKSAAGIFLDDDYTSIFNHADQSAEELTSHMSNDVSSDYTFDDLHDDIHDRRGEQAFPAAEGHPDEPSVPWSGLTCESLTFPKRLKINKRSTRSPRVLNNLFLAQELHCGERRDAHGEALSDSDSDSEAVSENTFMSSDVDANPSIRDNEILVMEFSKDGKYLAAAGRDSKIYIWAVISSPLSRLQYKSREAAEKKDHPGSAKSRAFQYAPVFQQEPERVFEGHTKSILTLDWSKNNFLLSGSMDRTVKLWNVERSDCLETFKHDDFVTAVKFHPNDDRFFLSGSLDNHVRLWSILDSSVAYDRNLGNDVLITALAFTPSGAQCVVGGFNGSLFGLDTQGLAIQHRVELKEKSLATPFSSKHGNKITGIKVFENLAATDVPYTQFAKWNLLITTNDSKVRLVDLQQTRLLTRFKGATNASSSIVASLSEDNRFIICGSEDHWCYVWENNHAIINNKLRIALRDMYNEGKHTVNHTHKKLSKVLHDNKLWQKLSLQRFLEDDSGQHYIPNENNSYASFHAHHMKVNCALFAPENTRRLLAFSDDIIYDLVKRKPLLEEYGILSSRSKEIEYAHTTGLDIGHIIITSDQTGLIKVFRQDSAYNVRRALAEFRKSSKAKAACNQNEGRSLRDSKLDLSALSMRSVKTRSRSPGLEHTPSIRLKFQSQFRNASGASTSPSRRRSLHKTSSGRSVPQVPTEVVSSSSQININKIHRSGDLRPNYVTLPMGRNEADDGRSLSDHSILSGEDLTTPRSMSLDKSNSGKGRQTPFARNGARFPMQSQVPRVITTAPTTELLPGQTPIASSGAERGRA